MKTSKRGFHRIVVFVVLSLAVVLLTGCPDISGEGEYGTSAKDTTLNSAK